jgi:cytochrome c-type biogenesis protein CcmF
VIAELGHFALILAFLLALAQAGFALAGAARQRRAWMSVARPAAAGQLVFVALSFGCLAWSFVQNDFSVLYVAQNSNSALPLGYRIAAVWGAHEGSLLLWILVQALWTVAVCAFSRNLPERFAVRVIGVLGLVAAGFMLFALATSNAFVRLVPAAAEGRDLNPVLQDPALAMHPPVLYLGYVGFSVAFAFAIAAMLEGRLDAAWARWTRPWTTAAWCFLTVGIALGSWWAYYELGWGGWWFWDAVENASFMPWLAGTALVHSLAVTEKRGLFKSWTLLLAITAFSLSLLGTFLVRSGVLVSVHAFASDPERGRYILLFLAATIGSALALYAWRAPRMKSDAGFALASRETFLLLNNILLAVATMLILVGTLYPLFLEALGLTKLSVGPPYFEIAFLIPMLPLVLLLAIGMHAAWKHADMRELVREQRVPLALALVAAIALPTFGYGGNAVLTAVGVFAAVWIAASSLLEPIARVRRKRRLDAVPGGVLGMSIAHFGLGVFILGVTITKSFSIEQDLGLRPGESATAGSYEFVFQGVAPREGPNYTATRATVEVRRDGRPIGTLHPEERTYLVQRNPMTESDIDASLARDLYVALGDDLGDGAWSLRVQYKPLVRLIWLGALIMAFGGAVALGDRRYRRATAHATERVAGLAQEA